MDAPTLARQEIRRSPELIAIANGETGKMGNGRSLGAVAGKLRREGLEAPPELVAWRQAPSPERPAYEQRAAQAVCALAGLPRRWDGTYLRGYRRTERRSFMLHRARYMPY